MTSVTTKDQITPGILSVLPLIYVAWSDSVLSPAEMRLIRNKIQSFKFLSEPEKEYLYRHIDPANPPGEKVFKSWLKAVKGHSRDLSRDEKFTLIDLGIQMVLKSVSLKNQNIWQGPKTRLALEELESALGVGGEVSARLLLDKLGKEAVPVVSDDEDEIIASLKSFLDGPEHELRDRVRSILSRPEYIQSYTPDKELYRMRILKQTKELAALGLGSYSFPARYGGKDKRGLHIAVFESLAYGDLSLTVKFGVQFGLFGGALFMLGTEKHHKKYLEAMHRGELLGCFAMTETGHGSNVKGLKTTATYHKEADTWIINSPDFASGKEYIGNALDGKMAVVFAQLIVDGNHHGIHAIIVPIRDDAGNLLPGIRITDCGYKMGLNGVDNGRLWFDHVQVPRENLLDRFGTVGADGIYVSSIDNSSKRFFTMLGTLVVGRISVGLASISASKKALAIAVKYALNRRQFGKNEAIEETLIMDYPTHQERLIPHVARTYAYHFALRALAQNYLDDDGAESRRIETLAAGLKAKASWHTTHVIQECREACGGKGYLQENLIPILKADTDIFTTFEGDNTVLMQLVAKGLLTEFKQAFHDEGIKAVIKFLFTRVGHKLNEYNAVQKRITDFEHLTSIDLFDHAFEYRYQKILLSISERMRKYLRRRIDPYQAFLRTQVHMIKLADAYIDQITLESFIQRLSTCEEVQMKETLRPLLQLYALDTIYNNRGWYLENDYMNGTKAKAIRRVRAKLIQNIRPVLGRYIEAFGINDELLAAPIALQEVS